jgi:hypothetical protein
MQLPSRYTAMADSVLVYRVSAECWLADVQNAHVDTCRPNFSQPHIDR